MKGRSSVKMPCVRKSGECNVKIHRIGQDVRLLGSFRGAKFYSRILYSKNCVEQTFVTSRKAKCYRCDWVPEHAFGYQVHLEFMTAPAKINFAHTHAQTHLRSHTERLLLKKILTRHTNTYAPTLTRFHTPHVHVHTHIRRTHTHKHKHTGTYGTHIHTPYTIPRTHTRFTHTNKPTQTHTSTRRTHTRLYRHTRPITHTVAHTKHAHGYTHNHSLAHESQTHGCTGTTTPDTHGCTHDSHTRLRRHTPATHTRLHTRNVHTATHTHTRLSLSQPHAVAPTIHTYG